MKGSDFIVKILEVNGVDYIFGVLGDIQVDFYKSLRNSKIKFITMRNEKSAVFAADIYSRVIGKVGVCFSTVAPGATNLVTGLANATADRSSVIAISDQLPTSKRDIEQHQYIEFNKLFDKTSGVVKDSVTINDVENIYFCFREAFTFSQKENKGAIHIGIPSDLMTKEVKKSEESLNFHISEVKHSLNATKIYQQIKDKKGAIIAGGILNRLDCKKEFLKFINKLKLPVITTFRGKGCIDENSEYYLGSISRHLQDVYKYFLKDLDFVLLIGYDKNEGLNLSILNGVKNVISINSANEIKEQDCCFDLKGLFNNLSKKEYYVNNVDLNIYKELLLTRVYGNIDMDIFPLRPHRIMEIVSKVYNKNTIFIGDVGLNKYYTGILLKISDTNEIYFSNGISSMAFSSGALGAKLAKPNKEVVVICGDGGFLMNPQEISTCMNYNIPITILILNNSGLGLVEQKQRKDFGSTYEVSFANPNYIKFAQAFGAEGFRINSWRRLEQVLNKCKGSNKVNIIDCPVSYREGL